MNEEAEPAFPGARLAYDLAGCLRFYSRLPVPQLPGEPDPHRTHGGLGDHPPGVVVGHGRRGGTGLALPQPPRGTDRRRRRER